MNYWPFVNLDMQLHEIYMRILIKLKYALKGLVQSKSEWFMRFVIVENLNSSTRLIFIDVWKI